MKPQELTIDSDCFWDLKQRMTEGITEALDTLMEKKLSIGSISTKIDIEIRETQNEETGEIVYQPIFSYDVNYKIGAKHKIGKGVSAGLYLEKTMDGRNIVASNQISMDELVEEET